MALLNERNLIAVTEMQESKEKQAEQEREQQMPPLCGWLLKRNKKFPYPFRRRWFVYDDRRGMLICYKDKSTNRKPLGFIDLGELDTIRSEDATGKKFKLVTSSEDWHLGAASAEIATMWMDEILARQSHLKEKRSAAFTSADLQIEGEDGEEDEDLEVVDPEHSLLFHSNEKTTSDILEHMEAASGQDGTVQGTPLDAAATSSSSSSSATTTAD